jgi:hypothetical protein
MNVKELEKIEREVQSFQNLAIAVITQAWLDAHHWRKSYTRAASRKFLTGKTPEWKESLEFWCGICKKDPKAIMDMAKKEFYEQGR